MYTDAYDTPKTDNFNIIILHVHVPLVGRSGVFPAQGYRGLPA